MWTLYNFITKFDPKHGLLALKRSLVDPVPNKDHIELFLNELLGGHLGANLTSVDFLVRAAVDYC